MARFLQPLTSQEVTLSLGIFNGALTMRDSDFINQAKEVKIKAAIASMVKAAQGTFFNICPIQELITALGDMNLMTTPEWVAIRAWHCVDFKNMTPAIREELAQRIQYLFRGYTARADYFRLLTTAKP